MARVFCRTASDIFAAVLDLRRAVFASDVSGARNPHCAAGIRMAVDRIAQKVLEDEPANWMQLYNLNLALRAMVYDLQDTKSVTDEAAEAILSKSFELERNYLARRRQEAESESLFAGAG